MSIAALMHDSILLFALLSISACMEFCKHLVMLLKSVISQLHLSSSGVKPKGVE